MTDPIDRFTRLLAGEPAAPDDIETILRGGRRALHRRRALTAVAGTAGAAALTAAVVVPVVAIHGGGSSDRMTVGTQPSPAATHCATYRTALHGGKVAGFGALRAKIAKNGRQIRVTGVRKHAGRLGVHYCTTPATTPATSPRPTSPPAPSYHYTAEPKQIAARLGAHLTHRVEALGFSIVYTRPFAQESSSLDKGHPSYYDGNVDVQLSDGPADIGVQVTHKVTTQVPFDGACNPPRCTQASLADGSVEQTTRIHAGSGGAMVIAVEVHRPDGLVVEAQQANYAFGPQATRAHSSQPLTLAQLRALAEDPQFSF